MIMQN